MVKTNHSPSFVSERSYPNAIAAKTVPSSRTGSSSSSQHTSRAPIMLAPNLSAAKISEINVWAQDTLRASHPSAKTSSYASGIASTAVGSERPPSFKYARLKSEMSQASASAESSNSKSARSSNVERPILVRDFTVAYSQLNQEIARSMGGMRSNAARILTGIGTFGSIGGAIAMGFVAPVALTGLLTGVGVPHGFAAAILGAGVGLAGIGLSIFAGAMVRSLTRRSLKRNPAFASKIIALKEIEANLRQQQKIDGLDHGNAALLHNTRLLLNKVDSGFGTSLFKQASNALTTPFTLFSKVFDSMRNIGKPASFDAQNQQLVPIKKRFVGERFRISLGNQPIVGDDGATAISVASQSKAASWLKTLIDAPEALPV